MARTPVACRFLTWTRQRLWGERSRPEYADKGIRVNAVAPGVIKTPMHAPETHAFLAGLHPLSRVGEIREVVEVVLYLESAAFVTGETLHVDGGDHAGHW